MTTFGCSPTRLIWSSTAKARSSWPARPHAFTSVEYVTAVGVSPAATMRRNQPKASSTRPTRAHRWMRIEKVRAFGCSLAASTCWSVWYARLRLTLPPRAHASSNVLYVISVGLTPRLRITSAAAYALLTWPALA